MATRIVSVPVNIAIATTATVNSVSTWWHSVLMHVLMLLLLGESGIVHWTAHRWRSLSVPSLRSTLIAGSIIFLGHRYARWWWERGEQGVGKVIGQQSTIAEDRIGQQLVARVILDKILLHRVQQRALSLPRGGADIPTVVIYRRWRNSKGRVHILNDQRAGNVVKKRPQVGVVL